MPLQQGISVGVWRAKPKNRLQICFLNLHYRAQNIKKTTQILRSTAQD
jgi:hypothetical protein